MKKFLKWGLIVLAVIVVLSVLFGGTDDTRRPNDPNRSQPSVNATTTQTIQPTAASKPTVAPTTAKPAAPKPTFTSGQQNAIDAAKGYLDYAAFSKSGLIEQLKYEGYSRKNAEFAVAHIKINWNEQAAKAAKDYLDYTSFSKSGLIQQLKFEGYTTRQATYGANKAL